VFVATEDSIDDLMRAVIQELRDSGAPIKPSKGPASEIVGASLELTNPRARLSRSDARSIAFSALGEFLWYLSGSEAADAISYYIKMYDSLAVDGTVEGAYGPRLRGDDKRLDEVIGVLRSKKDSRQAVLQIFGHADLRNALDVPCTCVIQFFLRDGLLDLVVYMRSNDAFKGLPHDVFCFTMLQELVARAVGAEVGRYVHTVGSLHLYDADKERADEFLNEGWQGSAAMPARPDGDQFGALEALLTTESELREGLAQEPVAAVMAMTYWRDLAIMLWAFRESKVGSAGLDTLAEQLEHDFFRIYMTERQLKVEGR
jgi:thymidylate synthase